MARIDSEYGFRPELKGFLLFTDRKKSWRYLGRGMTIVIQPSKESNSLGMEGYSTEPDTLVGHLKAIYPVTIYSLPRSKERDKHLLLEDLTEFFTHVDGAHTPSHIQVAGTNFRMARFLHRWMGGDMAIADSKEEPTPYNYAVSTETAKANLFSESTQVEMARLAALRDEYDVAMAANYSDMLEIEPRLPENNPSPSDPYFQILPLWMREALLRKRLEK